MEAPSPLELVRTETADIRDGLKQAQAMAAALIRTKGSGFLSRSGWANFQVPHNGSGSRQAPSHRVTTSGLPMDDDTVLASRRSTADTLFDAACLAGPPIISENRQNARHCSAMLVADPSITAAYPANPPRGRSIRHV